MVIDLVMIPLPGKDWQESARVVKRWRRHNSRIEVYDLEAMEAIANLKLGQAA